MTGLLTRRLTRRLAGVATPGVLLGALLATLLAPPASAAPTTTLNPAKLPRGADVAIAHQEGKTIVDGTVRFKVKAPSVILLGRSGAAYVVGTAERDGSGGRIHRYAADGTSVPLMPADIYSSLLSGDGQTVVSRRYLGNRASVVKVRAVTTGALVAQHTFRDLVSLGDVEGTQVLLSGWRMGTRLWDTGSDAVSVVSKRVGGAADLSADVFASYTGDPYNGGCTVVSSISRPAKRLWRTCDERVETFNADGTQMATVPILTDGLGPSWVGARTVTGSKLGAYQVRDGWFGAIQFETTTALLLGTNTLRNAATVRCTDTTCELASELTPAEQPRTS